MTHETNNPSANSFYSAGHPWYYVLGGQILRPSIIRQHVKNRKYEGYRTDIDDVAKYHEPQRSALLRKIRAEILVQISQDISRYRTCARELLNYRDTQKSAQQDPTCEELHVSISLKHNHIFNDFAHLLKIEALLLEQPDLFNFSGS